MAIDTIYKLYDPMDERIETEETQRERALLENTIAEYYPEDKRKVDKAITRWNFYVSRVPSLYEQ